MLSINTDNAVAVGTVAAGGATASIVKQHSEGIKNLFKSKAKDSFEKTENKVSKETQKVVKEAVKKDAKKAAKSGSKKVSKNAKKTATKVIDKVKTSLKNGKDKITNKTKELKGATSKAFNSLVHKTDWKRVGKAAGIAGGLAVATIAVKKAYNHFFGDGE